jgi:hypothetical protein
MSSSTPISLLQLTKDRFDQFCSFAEIASEFEPEAETIDAKTAEFEESEIAHAAEIETNIIVYGTANPDKNGNEEAAQHTRFPCHHHGRQVQTASRDNRDGLDRRHGQEAPEIRRGIR